MFFGLLDVFSRINSGEAAPKKEKAKRIDYYDDLPAGFW